MCQISLEMKTVILLYLFLAIDLSVFALIIANFSSEAITTSNLQTQRSTTFDQKFEPWNISVDKEAKTVNNDYSIPVEKRFGTKENLYNKKIPTIESELGYQAMQKEKKLREQLRRLNLLTIQKNQNYLQELMNDKRGKSSGRDLYPPHLYPNTYDIRKFDNWFMDRKRHPKILSENQDDNLEKIGPPSKQKSAFPMFPNQSGRLEEESAPTYKEESPLSMFPNQYDRSGEETVSPYKERVLLVFPNQFGRSDEQNVLPYKEENPPSMFPNQYGMSSEEVVPSYKEKSILLVFPNQYGRSGEENALPYKRESPLSIFSREDGRSGEEAVPPYKDKSVLLVFPNQYGRSGEKNVLPYKQKSPPSMFPNQDGRSGEKNVLPYKEESPPSMFPNQDGRSGEETVASDKEKSVRIVFPNQYGRLGKENALPYEKESPLSMFHSQDSRLKEETLPSYKEKSVLLVFPNQYGRSEEENALPYNEESPLLMFPSKDGRSGEESVPPYKNERVLSMFSNRDDRSGEETTPPWKEEHALKMFPNQNDRSGEENVPLSMFPNEDGRSAEENILPYKEKSAHFSKDISFISIPTASNVNEKLPNLLGITAMDANGIAENYFIKHNEESRIEKGFFKRNNLNFRNINDMTSSLNKIVTRSKNSENNQFKKQELSKSNYPKSDKEETLRSHFDFLDFSKTNEKEEKTESPLRTLELRFERNSTLDDIEDRNTNQLLHNRVYFERMPENTNFSWFVYVNCSRDKCLLTNNTDESELSSEGWILHNCTHYGCIEMYPRNESIRKNIGLILLVFSLCVLKAVVFLLILYYCRRMKLSRNAPGDADLDEEKSIIGEKKSLEKNHENDQNREVITETFETTSSHQKDIYNSDQDKETNSLVGQEVERDDSKDQHVGLCLINTTPNKSILIPKKSFEKKVHNKILTIPKCKSYRSSIPRLERWKKCKNSGTAKIETKRAVHNVERKTPKRAKATPGGDGDILLMNLDVEEDKGLCMAVKQDNTPKWSTLLENECKSFVSIDLSDSKF